VSKLVRSLARLRIAYAALPSTQQEKPSTGCPINDYGAYLDVITSMTQQALRRLIEDLTDYNNDNNVLLEEPHLNQRELSACADEPIETRHSNLQYLKL
jgi:hypothetical protein